MNSVGSPTSPAQDPWRRRRDMPVQPHEGCTGRSPNCLRLTLRQRATGDRYESNRQEAPRRATSYGLVSDEGNLLNAACRAE